MSSKDPYGVAQAFGEERITQSSYKNEAPSVERKFLGNESILIWWEELNWDDKALITVEVADGGIVGRSILTIPVGYLPVGYGEIETLAISVAKGFLTDERCGVAPGEIVKMSSVNVTALEGRDGVEGEEWKMEFQVSLYSDDPMCMGYAVDLGKDGWGTLRGVRW